MERRPRRGKRPEEGNGLQIRSIASTILAASLLGGCSGPSLVPPTGFVALAERWEGFPLGDWDDFSRHDPWYVAFRGHGRVAVVPDGGRAVLELAPQAANGGSETHAALVRSIRTFGDLRVTWHAETLKQLRGVGPPNPWEVAWGIWHYQDESHYDYAIAKPNGWEIGKVKPGPNGPVQQFLATGETPYAVGAWHTMTIEERDAAITLTVDGTPVGSPVVDPSPYRWGAIALYDEDAQVHFGDVRVEAP